MKLIMPAKGLGIGEGGAADKALHGDVFGAVAEMKLGRVRKETEDFLEPSGRSEG